MAKVSIGLRGWRFEEEEVFADDGSLRPVAAMSEEVATQVSRLAALVGSPCDACWLIHGDEDVERCGVAAVVYGEPMSEVVLCEDHEDDFVYWFREEGGSAHRGDPELEDAFHEWFAAGNRAPDDYVGVEHVETDPEALPEPPDPDVAYEQQAPPVEQRRRIDLREGEVYTGEDAIRDGEDDGVDLEDADLDLSKDYPS